MISQHACAAQPIVATVDDDTSDDAEAPVRKSRPQLRVQTAAQEVDTEPSDADFAPPSPKVSDQRAWPEYLCAAFAAASSQSP